MFDIIPKALKTLGSSPGPPIGERLIVLSMQKIIFKILNLDDAFIFLLGDIVTLETLIIFAS